ncbi:urease accessory UreF family protein [Teredinibacter turnerae]|uniref:urease accessory protein UreF n=1 Tax=Teredinibacter turnerae TaxID=2426 RepID=UPI0003666DF1|nr:urease accessory UreF family protein [Teredinibacter turnerae]
MNNQLLHLMHLVSPALPVGAYAYSQGLEYAVDSGWLTEPGELQYWITGVLEHSVGHLDLPVLLRIYRAWKAAALDEVDRWNDFVRANRETAELLLEDEQLGLALQRLLVSLQTEGADERLSSPPCFVTQFALAGVRRDIAEEDLLYGFAWSWLENQVAAATKIVPLGQTQAQQTLVAMMEKIPAVCAHALTLQDDELGVGLPALAMASSRHERQYSRLFRS